MKHFGDDVSTFFRKAATKIEELQVQASLGKAELADKLEEIKKEIKDKINHNKWDISADLMDKKEEFNHLKVKTEHLQVQAALAKAETAEELAEQKKNLSVAIRDVKNLIAKD